MVKKLTVLAAALALVCSLPGCFYVTFDEYYELSQDADEIASIQILENLGNNVLADVALAELEPIEFENFAAELEKLPFKNDMVIFLAAMDPSTHFGTYVVKVSYSDGAYELISCADYQEYYNADGEMGYKHYSLSTAKWESFLSEYMNESIIE